MTYFRTFLLADVWGSRRHGPNVHQGGSTSGLQVSIFPGVLAGRVICTTTHMLCRFEESLRLLGDLLIFRYCFAYNFQLHLTRTLTTRDTVTVKLYFIIICLPAPVRALYFTFSLFSLAPATWVYNTPQFSLISVCFLHLTLGGPILNYSVVCSFIVKFVLCWPEFKTVRLFWKCREFYMYCLYTDVIFANL